MVDFNCDNPSVLGFHLTESAGVRCDACGGFVLSEQPLHTHVDGHRACSPECAAELGHRVGAAQERLCEDPLGPSGRRYDILSLFAAAGDDMSARDENVVLDAPIPLRSFAERAWYAYLCLPAGRGERSRVTEIMGRHRRELRKLFDGRKEDAHRSLRPLIATALRVSLAWLEHGEGEAPKLVIAYRSRPIDRKFRCQDPSEWARKYAAIGGVVIRNPNNFQTAALFMGADLDALVIEHVAKEARGREQSLTVEGWARRLRLAQHRITGTGCDLRLPPAASIERKGER